MKTSPAPGAYPDSNSPQSAAQAKRTVPVRNCDAYTYDSLPEDLRECAKWPKVETSGLSQEDRGRFESYEKAIGGYLVHGNASQAAAEAGVHRNTFLEVFSRCITIASATGGIIGWQALLKHQRLKPYIRHQPDADGTGKSGMFMALLREHPEIQAGLQAYVLPPKDGRPRVTRPQKTRVFAKFKSLCAAAGIGTGQYPFNTKSKGRRSVERYVTRLLEAHPEGGVGHWYGHEAGRRIGLQTGAKAFKFAMKPLLVSMIDAHKIDCLVTIELPGPAGPQPVLIKRLWLVADVDPEMGGFFGYSVGIRQEVGAEDVERAIRFGQTPWKPRDLTIGGLEYHADAGFPNGSVEGVDARRAAVLRMDNAAAHYAAIIQDRARRATGAAITHGGLAQWWFNAIQERLFRTFENMGIQLITSSVGNSPTDPHRPVDSAANAIRHVVLLDDILQVIDVLFASFNATKSTALGNRSPLQVLRDGMQRGDVIPRPGLPPTVHSPTLGIAKERGTIRGSLENGRALYIQLDKERYSSPSFATRYDLVGQTAVIHVDEDDLRTIHAYDQRGEDLGILNALGRWRHTKHTRAMRKEINGLYEAGVISCDFGGDVVEIYHDHLIAQAVAQAEQAPKKVSTAATKVAHSSQRSGLPTMGSPTRKPKTEPKGPFRPHDIDVDWSDVAR